MEKLKKIVKEAIIALHRCGRYDAIARLVPNLDNLVGVKESVGNVFDVVDFALKWKESPEGPEYWKRVFEAMAFETGTTFRRKVNELLESPGSFRDFSAWDELEKTRLETDSGPRSYEGKIESPDHTLTVSSSGNSLILETEDPEWVELFSFGSSSEIVDFSSRVDFENPFSPLPGDAKALSATPSSKIAGATFVASVDGSVSVDPDGEILKSKKEIIRGEWDLFLEPGSRETCVRAVNRDDGTVLVSSFNEGLNRIFRGERDLVSETVRLAFVKGIATLGACTTLSK